MTGGSLLHFTRASSHDSTRADERRLGYGLQTHCGPLFSACGGSRRGGPTQRGGRPQDGALKASAPQPVSSTRTVPTVVTCLLTPGAPCNHKVDMPLRKPPVRIGRRRSWQLQAACCGSSTKRTFPTFCCRNRGGFPLTRARSDSLSPTAGAKAKTTTCCRARPPRQGPGGRRDRLEAFRRGPHRRGAGEGERFGHHLSGNKRHPREGRNRGAFQRVSLPSLSTTNRCNAGIRHEALSRAPRHPVRIPRSLTARKSAPPLARRRSKSTISLSTSREATCAATSRRGEPIARQRLRAGTPLRRDANRTRRFFKTARSRKEIISGRGQVADWGPLLSTGRREACSGPLRGLGGQVEGTRRTRKPFTRRTMPQPPPHHGWRVVTLSRPCQPAAPSPPLRRSATKRWPSSRLGCSQWEGW